MYYLFFGATVLSFLLTGPLLFFLQRIKAGQVEREEGPASHKAKSGTPTMGGLGFFTIIICLSLIFVDLKYLPVILLSLGFALIGLFDDLIKILNRQNLGLTFWQKIIVQTLFAAIFSIWMIKTGLINGPIYFFTIYLLFWSFIIVGAANATNLTDGLDGLLAGCSTAAFIALGIVCFKHDLMGGAAMSIIAAGSIFGFLFYNFPKARVFMGDTGSLSIGSLMAGIAIITGNEWLLALIGGVFVAEALSVIIQVASYKFFKKRIFKMAPLHHHFELLGYSEIQVVAGFWTFQAILAVLGVILT